MITGGEEGGVEGKGRGCPFEDFFSLLQVLQQQLLLLLELGFNTVLARLQSPGQLCGLARSVFNIFLMQPAKSES